MADEITDLLAARPAAAGQQPARQRQGIGLCLSGGGYRAMLFHAGALLRLNELGLLARLDFVSSVSGGSIAAGVLARGWSGLTWTGGVADNLGPQVIDRIVDFAGRTVDQVSVLGGLLRPGRSIGEQVAAAYRKHLFGDMSLRDLPDRPRFIFTAANLQSGALLRFSKPYLRDWRIGEVKDPDVPVALAVAASAAFPPVLSPVRLRLPADAWSSVADGLADPAYRTDVVLSDGGVYDNLGLEPVIKRCATVLVSDGGGRLRPSPAVAGTWGRHMARVLSVVDQQVRNLRSRLLIDGYQRGEFDGAYWGIRTPIDRYRVAGALPCPATASLRLAGTPTRLKALPEDHRRKLVNWGYAVSDAALRERFTPDAAPPAGFPWPASEI
jgi:NTE family protein